MVVDVVDVLDVDTSSLHKLVISSAFMISSSGRILKLAQVLSPLTSELLMFALAALVYILASRSLTVPVKKKSGEGWASGWSNFGDALSNKGLQACFFPPFLARF